MGVSSSNSCEPAWRAAPPSRCDLIDHSSRSISGAAAISRALARACGSVIVAHAGQLAIVTL